MSGNKFYNDNIGSGTGRAVKSSVKAGISFGSCLAIVVSYSAWHSIPWAIFHGLLSWVYVVYYFIKYVS